MKRLFKLVLILVFLLLIGFGFLQAIKKPTNVGDWQPTLSVVPTAVFSGDTVTVRNVRNFRYGPLETDIHSSYYDRTYNLNEIKHVWYITEPFNEMKYAAHTFVSFEFNNGDFLAITIEARKTNKQKFNIAKGLFRTYPLVYIAADERDVVLVRANLRKDKVYAYPVKLSDQKNARLLLVDMLTRMNKLAVEPEWYNSITANCTSSIAKHINKLSPNRLSMLSWQLIFTSSADKLALEHGLIDTDLPIDKAREKYLISDKSQKYGDVPNYSKIIRFSM